MMTAQMTREQTSEATVAPQTAAQIAQAIFENISRTEAVHGRMRGLTEAVVMVWKTLSELGMAYAEVERRVAQFRRESGYDALRAESEALQRRLAELYRTYEQRLRQDAWNDLQAVPSYVERDLAREW